MNTTKSKDSLSSPRREGRLIVDIIYEGLDNGLSYAEIAKRLNEELTIGPEWGA